MSGTPAVSIILPVRNAGGQFRGIESILAQTLQDREILIIDDGSNDGTSRQLSRWSKEKDVSVVCLRSPVGIAAALNLGVSLARSPLIARMDVDDFALPVRLERQLQFLQSEPEVDVLGSWFVDRHDDTGTERIVETPVTNTQIRRGFSWGNVMCHPTLVIRRHCFERFGNYSTSFPRFQDYELWMRWRRDVQFHNLPDPLLIHHGVGRMFAASRGLRRAEMVQWHLRIRLASLARPGYRLADFAGIGAMLVTQTLNGLKDRAARR